MSRHRLFVALRPPPFIRKILLGLMQSVAGARWQNDEQLHITLRFIGEVDRHQAEDIAAALGALHAPSPDLRVEGVGQFEKAGRPLSLWAGVTPAAPVTAIHRQINQLLLRVGIEPEQRAFLPHITLARGGRCAGMYDDYRSAHAALRTPPFRCDHVILYESEMGHGGSSYHPITRYPLAPPHAA
jgi:2'-5' RNA ligase